MRTLPTTSGAITLMADETNTEIRFAKEDKQDEFQRKLGIISLLINFDSLQIFMPSEQFHRSKRASLHCTRNRIYLPNTSATDKMQHKVNFLKQIKAGLNSEFFFSKTGCLISVKNLICSTYIPIAEQYRDGFMPFSRVLARSETQTAYPRFARVSQQNNIKQCPS